MRSGVGARAQAHDELVDPAALLRRAPGRCRGGEDDGERRLGAEVGAGAVTMKYSGAST